MRIIVVGAGIAGLSSALVLARAGHQVTILESARALAEVGAGVQLTPNTTKWFYRWGLASDILAAAILPDSFNVIDGVNKNLLGSISFQSFEEDYGGPYLVIHRADIHRILHEHATRAGVEVKLNSRVEHYHADQGRVTLIDGMEMTADLIIALDGIKSHARQFLGNDMSKGSLGNSLDNGGWAAYRLIAEVSELGELEESLKIGASHRCNCFIGDGCSIMTYKIKGQDQANLVLSHPDDVETTAWSQAEYRSEISELFKAFHPDLQKLLNITMANENYQITNWPVYMVHTLPRWSIGGGKLLLLGDNTHAMPYFLSMGVSMAAEDAASITECLSLLGDSHGQVSLQQAMELLEAVRKPRAEIVRDASLNAGRVIHLPEGKDRDVRNAELRDNGGLSTYDSRTSVQEMKRLANGTRYGIIDNTLRDWCYSYDVVEDIRLRWKERFHQSISRS